MHIVAQRRVNALRFSLTPYHRPSTKRLHRQLSGRLREEDLLKWRGIQNAVGDEVMNLLVANLAVARRYQLAALATANDDQPRATN